MSEFKLKVYDQKTAYNFKIRTTSILGIIKYYYLLNDYSRNTTERRNEQKVDLMLISIYYGIKNNQITWVDPEKNHNTSIAIEIKSFDILHK